MDDKSIDLLLQTLVALATVKKQRRKMDHLEYMEMETYYECKLCGKEIDIKVFDRGNKHNDNCLIYKLFIKLG